MHPRFLLLRLLADGRFHSGEELGRALGLSRASVWNLTREFDGLGVEVFALPGKGYRLADPFVPLDEAAIRQGLSPSALALLPRVEVLASVDSTSHVLARAAVEGLPSGSVCLAEHQSGGRGRRGRAWVSPYGANLYLSLLWRFELAPAALGPLSVAVGVLLAEALADVGAEGLGLKWPNDLLWDGRKLAGVLIEVSGEATGPAHAIIGIGVNASMSALAAAAIDQPWVDLRTVLGRPVDRNVLASRVLSRLAPGLERFAREGLAPFRRAWDRLDLAIGRRITLTAGEHVVEGECRGLDPDGALLVTTGGQTRRYLSGEVSVRVRA
jgi:BirA family biotin operon repressor/biotin-[acetyl-CoA-carboxylase] ligase